MKKHCGARAKIDIERPHFAAIKAKNGDVIWGVKPRVKDSFICLKKPGHGGAHHDITKMVEWPNAELG
jgi:hypothetical protein